MNVSTRGYWRFVDMVTDPVLVECVKKEIHPFARDLLHTQIERVEEQGSFNTLDIQFLKWIDRQAEQNFYIGPCSEAIVLFNRIFKGSMVIGLRQPHDKIKSFFEGHNRVIELLGLYSSRRGEGYKMMKKVIKLSKKMSVPVMLWTETEENTKYFERYGFKRRGRLGINNEWLMVYLNR